MTDTCECRPWPWDSGCCTQHLSPPGEHICKVISKSFHACWNYSVDTNRCRMDRQMVDYYWRHETSPKTKSCFLFVLLQLCTKNILFTVISKIKSPIQVRSDHGIVVPHITYLYSQQEFHLLWHNICVHAYNSIHHNWFNESLMKLC